MATKDIYEQLADMYVEGDILGGPKTPEFLKILSLQFTPAEAQLALHVRHAGGRLDEISQKSGIAPEKLKGLLNTMADKGTIYIEPGKQDPLYRAIGMAGPGLSETGLWGNIKYPFTVELGKCLDKFLSDWTKEKLCQFGFPLTPVRAGAAVLPDDALPEENINELIKVGEHWSVSVCPCRLSRWLAKPGDHCSHILETCIHMGDMSRWSVEHGLAREITYDEAVDLMRRCNEDGLVHTLTINYAYFPPDGQNNWMVCNCCDCCVFFRGWKDQGTRLLIPSPFIAQVDADTCKACKICAERCPMDAIEVEEAATVNGDLCIGCGVCVPTCETESVRLVRRPEA